MFSIDHIGVAVKSLAASKGIYEKLGLKLAPEETVEAEQVRVVMVPLGESRIELLEPTSPDSVIAKFIAKRGEGLHHVSLRVPDLEAAVERLKKDPDAIEHEAREKLHYARPGEVIYTLPPDPKQKPATSK